MIVFRPSILLLVLVSLSSLVLGQEDGELKAVIVLFRHGDRSPLSSWPNDEYFGDSSLWPDGYGQLNNMGKQRHYELGQWFRKRYDGFLPARYNRSDIYVRSTDVDRTLMSAASNLAGLYPPSDDQIWNDNIPWQAIPIHTAPIDSDPILTDSVSCPKHDRLYEEMLESSEIQEFNREHAELFRNISEVTGYSVDEVSISTFSQIFSDVTIYRGFNLTLPDWTEYFWPEIKALAAKTFQLSTYTQDLARLRVGPFMNYFTDYLNSINAQNKLPLINQEKVTGEEVQKFLMLSAHDTTLANRMNAMGVFPDAVPEFASSIIWEVKSGNSGNLYVNMYFKNSTHLSLLTVPGCNLDCYIDEFVKVLQPITVSNDQWTNECYENKY